MRNAQPARLFGASALAAALLLAPGCRDNASPQVNAPELQQPASGPGAASPATGGSGSAGTEATGAGNSPSTDMSGRPATGNTGSGPQEGGAASPARDTKAGSQPQPEEEGGTERTSPGHERETR